MYLYFQSIIFCSEKVLKKDSLHIGNNMKEKKNIDKLFTERLKDFEVSPSPHVWDNIQAELKKEKKDRKVIPLWIKYGGVAALLALLLTVGNWVFEPFEATTPAITHENVRSTKKEQQQKVSGIDEKKNEVQIASEESTEDLDTSADGSIDKDEGLQPSKKSIKTPIASQNIQRESADTKKSALKPKDDLYKGDFKKDKGKEAVATTTDSKEKSEEIKKGKLEKGMGIEENKDAFKQNKEDAVAVTEQHKKDAAKSDVEIAQESNNKKSILDAIEEQKEAIATTKIQKEKPEQRWAVAPNIAPVYYSSFGNGSSIDPSFDNNPQKGDVNMSYGVQVSYALNNRLSLRTGLNNVDLSYSTSDIAIGTGPVSMALRSINYGPGDIVVTAIDKGSIGPSGYPNNGFGDITLKSTDADARLIQNINYYEIPLELKYALLDTKLGVNLIGGVSTLLLGNNEVSVKSNDFSSVLGEANNLSSVSFSTNIGLGLDYKISKKFTFNIEPMFKYQLNTYTDSSVNFKPYYFGVYSGLSFKF